DEDGESQGKVKLDNAFISGLEAMLPLRIESGKSSQMFIVAMHLEGDEWRIDEFGPWEKTDLGLAKLLHQPTEMEKQEAAAMETLRNLGRALVNYAVAHPRIGYPRNLAALTEPFEGELVILDAEDRQPQGSFSSLLDESFAADPLIKAG